MFWPLLAHKHMAGKPVAAPGWHAKCVQKLQGSSQRRCKLSWEEICHPAQRLSDLVHIFIACQVWLENCSTTYCEADARYHNRKGCSLSTIQHMLDAEEQSIQKYEHNIQGCLVSAAQ